MLDFTLSRLVGSRVLPFDESAAIEAAGVAAELETAGTHIGQADCQIADITRTRGVAIATRDVGPLQQADLTVIKPFVAMDDSS